MKISSDLRGALSGRALVVAAHGVVDPVMQRELEQLGLSVEGTLDRQQVLRRLESGQVRIIVVATSKEQRAWCRMLRRASNGARRPVLICVGAAESKFARVKAKLAGCDGWIAQPIEGEALRSLFIAHSWRMRQPITDSLADDVVAPAPGVVLETLANPIVILDPNGDLISCNSSFLELSGQSAESVVGVPWSLLAGVASDSSTLKSWLAGPFPQRMQASWSRDDGVRWFDWQSTGLYQDDGELEYIVATGTDVTLRQRDAQLLVEDCERFRNFAETAADWFWETDDKLRLSFVSSGHEEVTGVASERILNWSIEQVISRYSPQQPVDFSRLVSDMNECRAFTGFDYNWQRPDGEMRMLRLSARPIFDADERYVGYRGVGMDVTRSYHLTEELAHQATHDALTGLVNRREFEQRLDRVVESAHNQASQHALFYMDLDHFKRINDTCGHAAGDELLRRLGALFRGHIRSRDTLGRLGGDEFAVLIEHSTLEAGLRVASALLSAVKNFRFEWEGQSFRVGLSVGVVMVNESMRSASAAQQAADSACYAAKNLGGNRIYVNHKGNVELDQLRKDQRWAMELKRALSDDRFQLDYQPIVPLSQQSDAPQLQYIELLLRMIDDSGNLVRPRIFWPIAERNSLVTRLDRWVVRTALAWMDSNPKTVEKIGLCFINLAPASVKDDEFLGFVIERLANTRVPAQKICFEITEEAVGSSLSRAVLFVKALKSYGCRFALDNFGQGQFSLGTLKKLPVDFLKLDRLYVRHLDGDPVNFALVKSLSEISRVLGKTTIAECVEDEATLNRLREIGVDFAQGYHTGRPRMLERQLGLPIGGDQIRRPK